MSLVRVGAGNSLPPLPARGADLSIACCFWAAVWEFRTLLSARIGCRISGRPSLLSCCHRADVVSAYLGEAAAVSRLLTQQPAPSMGNGAQRAKRKKPLLLGGGQFSEENLGWRLKPELEY